MSLVVGITVLVNLSIAALVFIAGLVLSSRNCTCEPRNDTLGGEQIYEDKDGVATVQSQTAYLKSCRPWIPICLSACGLALSMGAAISETRHLFQLSTNVPVVGLWVLSTAHAILLKKKTPPILFFKLEVFQALICTCIAINQIVLLIYQPNRSIDGQTPDHKASELISASHLFLCVSIMLLSICSPRRPNVFTGQSVVDGQYTVSLLKRFTFAWASHKLKQARLSAASLDLVDLPEVHHGMRSATLLRQSHTIDPKQNLWRHVFLSHKQYLSMIYTIGIAHAMAQLASQWVIYKLLQALENRQQREEEDVPWVWVCGLGISIIFAAWLETQLLWLNSMRINIALRSQLTAVLYSKLLRKKNVTSYASSGHDSAIVTSNTVSPTSSMKPSAHASNGKTKSSPSASPPSPEMAYDINNLVGLDAQQVVDFMSASHLLPSSLCKLAVSIIFLCHLLGWQGVLCGLMALMIVNCVNFYCSRLMGAAQARLMSVKDVKMGLIDETLRGIKQIKFTAMEDYWLQMIYHQRDKELQIRWYLFILRTILVGLWQFGPLAFSAVSLAVYASLKGSLSPSVAFTALGIFAQIEGALAIIPKLFVQFFRANVSTKRITQFLKTSDQLSDVHNCEDGCALVLQGATFSWPHEEAPTSIFRLTDINTHFQKGQLTIISGATGSGKSLLLNALVGEADRLRGLVIMPTHTAKARLETAAMCGSPCNGGVAFVSQNVWIENASIKNNILFGLPYDQKRYSEATYACALRPDITILGDGDETEVGVGGTNLSGGQKWRISFARALYSSADILVIDDIFSAIDAHVSGHLYQRGLHGPLARGRTRILATHHTDLCGGRADRILQLSNGRLVDDRPGGIHLNDEGLLHDSLINIEEKGVAALEWSSSEESEGQETQTSEDGSPLSRSTTAEHVPKAFIEAERREVGAVKWTIYKFYIQAAGGALMLLFVLTAHVIYSGSILGRSWWLSIWTRSTAGSSNERSTNLLLLQPDVKAESLTTSTILSASTDSQYHQQHYYLVVFLLLSLVVSLAGLLKFFSVLLGSIRASKRLFEDMCNTMFCAPNQWFDTIPSGRILNRFTSDFEAIDSSLADGIGFFLTMCLQIFTILVSSLFVSPYIIFIAVLLFSVSTYLARMYLPGARDVKRLESVARSPVFEQLQSTMAGVSTIRAYGKCDMFLDRMLRAIDDYAKTSFHRSLFNLWLMLHLNAIGATFTTAVAVAIVVRQDIDASLAGFALTFALQFTVAIEWTVRQFSATQLAMNSVERIREYALIATEKQGGHPVPAAWPSNGQIKVQDLCVSYRKDGSELVLKKLNMSIPAHSRVGIVGRTGCGKTTLSQALFRFLEAQSGAIHIDGINIANIKLRDLRSRMVIIPQDATLFRGTVRSNLDPTGEFSDERLSAALQHVRFSLGPSIAADPSSRAHDAENPESQPQRPATNNDAFHRAGLGTKHTSSTTEVLLSHPISSAGANLSHGQRQLLHLARALLSRGKIILLDEATSAVDKTTEAILQQNLLGARNGDGSTGAEDQVGAFADRTIIMIAHRLTTLVGFDLVFVMEGGRVMESGSPAELLAIGEGGLFWSMVREGGGQALERRMLRGW